MVNQTVISVNGDKKIDVKVTSISVKNFKHFSMFFTRHKSVVFNVLYTMPPFVEVSIIYTDSCKSFFNFLESFVENIYIEAYF